MTTNYEKAIEAFTDFTLAIDDDGENVDRKRRAAIETTVDYWIKTSGADRDSIEDEKLTEIYDQATEMYRNLEEANEKEVGRPWEYTLRETFGEEVLEQ